MSSILFFILFYSLDLELKIMLFNKRCKVFFSTTVKQNGKKSNSKILTRMLISIVSRDI